MAMDTLLDSGLEASQDFLYRKERVAASYLDARSYEDQQVAIRIAEQLASATPLASTVVIIPVAAHQEEHVVAHTIEQYSRQEPNAPFSLVLGLNTNKDLKDPAVTRCLNNATAAAALHPGLDIRMSMTTYEGSPTIGRIRYDLWNGVLRQALHDGTIRGELDVIGINHDADLVKLPRQYIARVQAAYDTDPFRRVASAYTRVRHATDPRFPNISRVTAWSDYSDQLQDSGFEAGAIIPMASCYADHGGFNPKAKINEVGKFILHSAKPLEIPTGNLQTSPRRMIARLPMHGPSGIWTEASFGSDDDCRDPTFITDNQDITKEAAYAEIRQHYEENIDGMVHGKKIRMRRYLKKTLQDKNGDKESTPLLVTYFTRRRALADRALRSVAQAPDLADHLQDRYDAANIRLLAQHYLRRLAEEDTYLADLDPTK